MAYLLAAFCLFVIIALVAMYFAKTSTRYTQISYGELFLINECLKEIEFDAAQWEQSAIHLDVREAAKRIKGKAFMAKNICIKNMDRV